MKPAYQVRKSPVAGRGLFATRDLRKGARIIEYLGKRLTEEQAEAEDGDDDELTTHHTFHFRLEDGSVIDGGRNGNAAKYINHSCSPNCEAFEDKGRIFIHAKKPIKKGEELFFDYGLSRGGPWRKHYADLYACRCGSRRCRGTILKDPMPPKYVQERARRRAKQVLVAPNRNAVKALFG